MEQRTQIHPPQFLRWVTGAIFIGCEENFFGTYWRLLGGLTRLLPGIGLTGINPLWHASLPAASSLWGFL
jgi:hypothetical protein